ncbi:hypothetical protein DPMN_060834 [Dreissena polymorpha]|uniref:HAT C-terminal dimerisation domain-containing protein n=1 Tax=Dreissena polymorpha TaxID=45954 RepID=A0A9D4C6M1_DREPO|nr:hypothetical protein DPMN_060834 [Dreissena polymorpha]
MLTNFVLRNKERHQKGANLSWPTDILPTLAQHKHANANVKPTLGQRRPAIWDDVNNDTLKVQLETLKTHFSKQNNYQIRLPHVLDYMSKLPPTLWVIYSDVVALIRILLTMQATNATSERTFSALRRIKTHLRSTLS